MEKKNIYITKSLCLYLKLAQYCKSIMLQKKNPLTQLGIKGEHAKLYKEYL